ncbi:37S ribosomal protein S35, mitochondrial [Smittium mucronatum]|uniref:37S ribosomal protein S35, mitochondrial n=1 Tax=Smittium mucronatum TaxID=133383 RepID=A0A1R0GT05_9FUNG|nr:37S ribosomal protein S35, mitochondrial [Smittium mucronatum]
MNCLFRNFVNRPNFTPRLYKRSVLTRAYSTGEEKSPELAKDEASPNKEAAAEGEGANSLELETVTEEEVFGEELDPMKIAYKQAKFWINGEGKKYKGIVDGSTNYVGGRIPFPMNPYFRPRPPLADSVKVQMYNMYINDPRKYTPRLLGQIFKVSIKRVEAILKLKAIEAQKDHEGEILQTKFQAGMENILGVTSSKIRFNEPLSLPGVELGAPRFKVISESQTFDEADAAKELKRESFKSISAQVNKDRFYEINYPGLKPTFAPRNPKLHPSTPKPMATKVVKEIVEPTQHAAGTVISKNPILGNKRFDFVFTDTSKKTSSKDRLVLVRKKDGTLVNADRSVRQARINQVWSNMNYVA